MTPITHFSLVIFMDTTQHTVHNIHKKARKNQTHRTKTESHNFGLTARLDSCYCRKSLRKKIKMKKNL